MIWEETWPNYKWTDEQACRKMITHYHLDTLVSFGKTKIFIKTPKTVYYLEEEREKKMPELVCGLKKYTSYITMQYTVYDVQYNFPYLHSTIFLYST